MKTTTGLLIVCSIAVALCFGTATTKAEFGRALTDSEMSEMFGGGFVLCGDRDCDTVSGSCPGGDTCPPGDTSSLCTQCKSGAGETCGTPAGAGWQCVPTTESCNGNKGVCMSGVCQQRINPNPTPTCGTRPDC